MGGVFHQDADLEGLELDALLEEELRGWGAAACDPIISEIHRAFRYFDVDENAFTPQDLGCDQYTSAADARSSIAYAASSSEIREEEIQVP